MRKRFFHDHVYWCALQEVNEDSLKRLNGYLEHLQKPGSPSAQPVNLTFYVRETKDRVTDAGSGILSSGIVSRIRSPTFCVSKCSFLVLRVSDSEFHPPHKGRLEHGNKHFEVLQPACGAHEQTEVKPREMWQDA